MGIDEPRLLPEGEDLAAASERFRRARQRIYELASLATIKDARKLAAIPAHLHGRFETRNVPEQRMKLATRNQLSISKGGAGFDYILTTEPAEFPTGRIGWIADILPSGPSGADYLLCWQLPAGYRLERHWHVWDEKIWVVHGVLNVVVGDALVQLDDGDGLLVRAKTPHSLEATRPTVQVSVIPFPSLEEE